MSGDWPGTGACSSGDWSGNAGDWSGNAGDWAASTGDWPGGAGEWSNPSAGDTDRILVKSRSPEVLVTEGVATI